MILVNLLPDLRQAKLKEARRRQLVSGVAILIWIVCGGLVVVMALVEVSQKALIHAVSTRITNKEDALKQMPDLIPAMTAQQHLSSLSSLYGKRVYLTKFFQAYMQADPVDVFITSMGIDPNNVMTINGTAPSYAEVAKVARALEASNVKVGAGASESNSPYFSDVSITSVASPARGKVDFAVSATLQPEVTSASQ
jgi:hypothetical protein